MTVGIIILFILLIVSIININTNEHIVNIIGESIVAFLLICFISSLLILKGEKRAYINMLEGKENPYERVIEQEHIKKSDTTIKKSVDTTYVYSKE